MAMLTDRRYNPFRDLMILIVLSLAITSLASQDGHS